MNVGRTSDVQLVRCGGCGVTFDNLGANPLGRRLVECRRCGFSTQWTHQFDDDCRCRSCCAIKRDFCRGTAADVAFELADDSGKGEVPVAAQANNTECNDGDHSNDGEGGSDSETAYFRASCYPPGAYTGVDDGTGRFVCAFCGDTDPRNVVFNEQLYKYVSKCCGALTVDDPVPPSCFACDVPVQRSTTYNPDTHAAERIRMDAMCEPAICGDDVAVIQHAIDAADSAPRSKEEVRRVLRQCNRATSSTRFTKRYLEKWKSIVRDFCGFEVKPTLNEEQRTRVSALKAELALAFRELKAAKHPLFVNRKHQPNYNLTFQMIFRNQGIPFSAAEWPAPKTAKCVVSSNLMLNEMFKFLHIKRLKNRTIY